MISNKIELIFWDFFNITIRITGYWFILASIIFIIFSIIQLMSPLESIDITITLIGMILSLVCLIMGWFIIRAKKFYPKYLKDKNLTDK